MSDRFRLLSRRITELKAALLPTKFSPTGLYKDRTYERARAFRVLAHAEFESFIEDRALEALDRAFKLWQSSGTIRPCLLALVAYKETSFDPPTSFISPPQRRSPDLASRIEKEKNNYNWYVRNKNHGIKEQNILKILLPLGFLEHEIDVTWLNMLEAWAGLRGNAAHQTGKMQVQIDPQHEYKTVREILRGFRDVDNVFENK